MKLHNWFVRKKEAPHRESLPLPAIEKPALPQDSQTELRIPQYNNTEVTSFEWNSGGSTLQIEETYGVEKCSVRLLQRDGKWYVGFSSESSDVQLPDEHGKILAAGLTAQNKVDRVVTHEFPRNPWMQGSRLRKMNVFPVLERTNCILFALYMSGWPSKILTQVGWGKSVIRLLSDHVVKKSRFFDQSGAISFMRNHFQTSDEKFLEPLLCIMYDQYTEKEPIGDSHAFVVEGIDDRGRIICANKKGMSIKGSIRVEPIEWVLATYDSRKDVRYGIITLSESREIAQNNPWHSRADKNEGQLSTRH